MKEKKKSAQEIRTELFQRYPQLEVCRESIMLAFGCLKSSYKAGGKLLIAGNGGSAADSEHIVGELMKSFQFAREADPDTMKQLKLLYGENGADLAEIMEGALPAIPLTSMPALSTAFANDVEPTACFAQMVNALGRPEDVFLGITTSGNSKNILLALMMAKAKGMSAILLTGETGGVCRGIADISICVPERETAKVQELHLPVYHALCAMLESALFQEKQTDSGKE